jgi:broad specificity phosphatase PhoE
VTAALFITHPEVVVDPAVPVPDWRLSGRGIARMTAFAGSAAAAKVGAIYCSAERKAREAAAILARERGLKVTVVEALHENDRSATGFLEPAEFEATADRFFADPLVSIRGWERAADAQARIVAAVRAILASDGTPGDLAIVAHGAIGALLLCHLAGEAIHRRFDQPGRGGGNLFAFRRPDLSLLHGWRPIDPGPAAEGEGPGPVAESWRLSPGARSRSA